MATTVGLCNSLSAVFIGKTLFRTVSKSLKSPKRPLTLNFTQRNITKNANYHISAKSQRSGVLLNQNVVVAIQTRSLGSYSEEQLKKSVDLISEKFSEAMGLLDDARSSMGTTYFSVDMKDAEDMVNETLKDYEDLLANLDESQQKTVMRSIGLKMQELKAQIQIVRESVRD